MKKRFFTIIMASVAVMSFVLNGCGGGQRLDLARFVSHRTGRCCFRKIPLPV